MWLNRDKEDAIPGFRKNDLLRFQIFDIYISTLMMGNGISGKGGDGS
jgi:hypothetical protein